MSRLILGIDTSNYTTSAALYDADTKQINTASKLLSVGKNQIGLRQSEAVFQHTRALPDIIESVIKNSKAAPSAIAVSARPRDAQDSYMPCFIAGLSTARSISNVLKIPVFEFSHQSGHITAAAFGANKTELLNDKFIAFHLSGGTTEALLVTPDNEKVFSVKLIAKTLDLNAGQVVDRVGNMLDISFPAGKSIDALAQNGVSNYKISPSLKGCDCCLSGIVNRCETLIGQNETKENVARFCLEYILKTLDLMTERLLLKYGDLPLLYAGGVMSNSLIKSAMQKKYGANFAPPAFSSDNAAGIAVLGSMKYESE